MNTIKLSDIIVPNLFRNSKPNTNKLDKVRDYFEKHKKIDKPLILKNNILLDNYTRYLVAKEKGLEEVPYVNSSISYIIGKFKHSNKEYIWKNINNIPIKIGDKVLVKSKCKNGKNKAIVTVVKIFESSDINMLRHKPVIKNLDNTIIYN